MSTEGLVHPPGGMVVLQVEISRFIFRGEQIPRTHEGVLENGELIGSVSDIIEQDVFEVLTLEGSVAARNHIGGTAPDQVRAAANRAREALAALKGAS